MHNVGVGFEVAFVEFKERLVLLKFEGLAKVLAVVFESNNLVCGFSFVVVFLEFLLDLGLLLERL